MTLEEFTANLDGYSNHRPLLWEALELTKIGDVVEMGCGYGSTPYLKQYCKENGRTLYSYESDPDWFRKFEDMQDDTHRLVRVVDWDMVGELHLTPSVLFIDNAPGERRKIDLERFALRARVIVIHDSEPTGGGNYQVRQHFSKFKYVKDYESSGAWASMLSNFVPF